MTAACHRCKFWNPSDVDAEGGVIEERTGECRQAPPTPAGRSGSRWPTVRGDDWCGGWQPSIARIGTRRPPAAPVRPSK